MLELDFSHRQRVSLETAPRRSGDLGEELASMYFDIRERVIGATVRLDDRALGTRVPACPDWTVHQLVAHLVSVPMAIIAGDVPETVMAGGDPNPWLRELVEEAAGRSIGELARWWASDDDALAELIPGAGLLLADLFTHESDLHGALGSRGHRDAPELDSQIDATLAGIQKDVGAAGLPPVCVDTGSDRRCSGEGEPGWTLRTGFWEAHRALNSRRTRDELMAMDHSGDPLRYVEVLDGHLPLPARSLGENR